MDNELALELIRAIARAGVVITMTRNDMGRDSDENDCGVIEVDVFPIQGIGPEEFLEVMKLFVAELETVHMPE